MQLKLSSISTAILLSKIIKINYANYHNHYNYKYGLMKKQDCHNSCQTQIENLIQTCDPAHENPEFADIFQPIPPINCEKEMLKLEEEHRRLIWESDQSGHKNDGEIHKEHRTFNIHMPDHIKNLMYMGRLKARCESMCEWELMTDCFEFCHDEGKNNQERTVCSRQCLRLGEKSNTFDSFYHML